MLPLLFPYLMWAACLFAPPVDGPVVREFAPLGRYGGHWGIDLAVPVGTPVRSIAPGIVTFSGSVAGRLSVTVDHGGGLRSSYSYLTERTVATGQRIDRGAVVGVSGVDHGIAALHLSIRVGNRYIDPATVCGIAAPSEALRLAS
jgi:murein DD-endopeptidase MepM/ murein hydrolase activator NlpD